MKRLLTYLTLLIVATGCGEEEHIIEEIIIDEHNIFFKYNPFDEVFDFDTLELQIDSFVIDTNYDGNLTYTKHYENFEIFFKADTNQSSMNIKGIEFMLDTVSIEKSVIDSFDGNWYFDEYAKLPFDTVKADKIMELFNLKRQIPNTEGWLTYINKDDIEFTLVFGYWVDGSKSIAMRQLLYLSEENKKLK